MNAYFSTPERIATLVAVAHSWLRTPFVPHACVKGAGADCIHWVGAALVECGHLKSFEFEAYSMDEGKHLKASKILKWFAGRNDFEAVDGRDLQPGDVFCFRVGRETHHVGLMLTDGKFMHALAGREVIESDLRESFYTANITAIFRPLEVQP